MGVKHSKTGRYTEGSSSVKSPPPVRPPSKSRKKLLLATFEAIDTHALKAPVTACVSVTKLAQYLVQPAKNDIEKVRAFYKWIAENISYDAFGVRLKTYGRQDAERVLQKRQGVCEGYANLFLSLCSEVGIPCKMVIGFSKGRNYNPEIGFTPESETAHAWNIVYVSGQWLPVDVTWGAGSVNEHNRFQKRYEDIYFLTDPKDFAVKHFPYMDHDMDNSKTLQLLKRPLSLEEFNKSAGVDTTGIIWGLVPTSHKQLTIEVEKECSITFKTRHKDLQNISCHMTDKSPTDYEPYVVLRKTGQKRFTIDVTPPKTGKYDLRLYGRAVDSNEVAHSQIITYKINCRSVHDKVLPRPLHTGLWGVKRDVDVDKYGFASNVRSNDVIVSKNGTFKLRLNTRRKPKAIFRLEDANKKDLRQYICPYLGRGFIEVIGSLPKEGVYKLILHCNSGADQREYDHLGEWMITCNNPPPEPALYPIQDTLWGARPEADEYGFLDDIFSKSLFTTRNGELQLQLKTSKFITTSVKLYQQLATESKLDNHVLEYFSGNTLVIKVRLPKAGFYKLSLFAKHEGRKASQSLDLVADFLVESKSDAANTKSFPKVYTHAKTYGCVLLEPMHGSLAANQTVRLRLRSKNLKRIMVNNDVHEKKSGDLFDISFEAPGKGFVGVFGTPDQEGNKFDGLYEYTIS
ncbi:kyphoscoliosis peptidase-like [Haliotis rubra]|uniref:kyphoscoliosis peptidase-like n=1 Tax=Haliotis rubra TaxID=36100 RepID=UPI001EE50DE9|nr:kyphoscoliosis peptidase-like [Haliotis rubra]